MKTISRAVIVKSISIIALSLSIILYNLPAAQLPQAWTRIGVIIVNTIGVIIFYEVLQMLVEKVGRMLKK